MQMAVLKSERLKTLKAKVKAEMLRRSKSGSVAAYGGADYDYSVAPGPGTSPCPPSTPTPCQGKPDPGW